MVCFIRKSICLLLWAPALLSAARYECSADLQTAPSSRRFGIGTNFGGWLVLEPWITPSLFYQFLGATEKFGVHDAKEHIGMDSYTFCTALGPEEANRQLRQHWKTWLTETHVRDLHDVGVRHVRIPVADWMFVPYAPYEGCFDGAMDELNRALGLLQKYNMTGLLDIHCVKDSANGLDNGGHSMHVQWYNLPDGSGATHFNHYEYKTAHWIGAYNLSAETYGPTNYANLNHTYRAFEVMIDLYKDSPAVFGLEAVNEPWIHTPDDALKEFYWQSYQLVQRRAPHWLFVVHDSFNATLENWGDFMVGCRNFAIDSHLYQAWNGPAPIDSFIGATCQDGPRLNHLREGGLNLVVGEWSLATDNCAMWLNGFNDNIPNYPQVDCMRVTCAEPYMGSGQPGAPPTKDGGIMNDPHGTGESFVINGTCPIDKPFENEDENMKRLVRAKLFAYHFTHGSFYWNFRTEIAYRWSFQEVIQRGWLLPQEIKKYNNWLANEDIDHACDKFLDDESLATAHTTLKQGNDESAAYGFTWFEHLLVWVLLCGAAYVVIILARRMCRGYSNQSYIIIQDEEDRSSL